MLAMHAVGGNDVVDEPRWCRFKARLVVFACVPAPEAPGRTRPRRCLERTPECVDTHRCLYAGSDADPFRGSI